MQKITIHKKNINIKTIAKKPAKETDGSIIIDKPTLMFDEDWNLLIAILDLDFDKKFYLEQLEKNIKWITSRRTDGMFATAKIFWKRPRVSLRYDFCSNAALTTENEKFTNYLLEYCAKKITELYKRFDQEKFTEHEKKMIELWDDRKYEKSIFTSWIINKNNPLPYHYDAWNLKNCFSWMITIKDKVDWWYLMVPEYDLQIRTRDWSLIMFDWQSLLHWVSPIRKHEWWYRYTTVFYTMKWLRNCLSPKEELKRIQKKKTELYQKRKQDLLMR